MTHPKLAEQMALERRSVTLGRERYLERVDRAQESGLGALEGPTRGLVQENVDAFTKALERYVHDKQASTGRSGVAAEWMEAVGPDMAAWITLQVVLRGFPEDRDAQQVAREIAWHLQMVRHASRGEGTIRGGGKEATRRRVREQAGDLGDLRFKPGQALRIGGPLLTLLFNSTRVVEPDEKLEGKEAWRGRKVVFTDDTRLKVFERALVLADRWPRSAPMVVPPRPWSRSSRGGYVGALRDRWPLIKQRPKAELDGVAQFLFDSLNRVQETAWRVNGAVLQLAEEVAQLDTHLLARKPYPLTPERTARTRAEAARLSKVRRFRTTLAVAKEMAGVDRIYFPHHLDFRGRFYPIPQPLNPQGDDLARALLCFADGKPIGEEGAFWLALHGANCLGETPEGVNLAQETLERRVELMGQLTDAIDEAATDPLSSELMKTAVQHGDPWQFYAFAIEWAAYMKTVAEGRETEFVSHVPCGQDGSNNGLQHIAALWRDEDLAGRVNLLRSEGPNDFYTDMLHAVEERLSAEAQGTVHLPETWTRYTRSGRKTIRKERASATEREKEIQRRRKIATSWLNSGYLNRRVMKTPAMTYSYGASRHTFMEKTADHIRDQVPEPFDRPFSSHQRVDAADVFEADPNWVPAEPSPSRERERAATQSEPTVDASVVSLKSR